MIAYAVAVAIRTVVIAVGLFLFMLWWTGPDDFDDMGGAV